VVESQAVNARGLLRVSNYILTSIERELERHLGESAQVLFEYPATWVFYPTMTSTVLSLLPNHKMVMGAKYLIAPVGNMGIIHFRD